MHEDDEEVVPFDEDATALEAAEDQIMHLRAVLGALCLRMGGRSFLSEAELDTVLGQEVRLTFDDATGGIRVEVALPGAHNMDRTDCPSHPAPAYLQ